MKKHLPFIGLAALLSGCALFHQPPNEATARRLEQQRPDDERTAAIAARTADYEKQGLSTRDARALAESQYPTSRP